MLKPFRVATTPGSSWNSSYVMENTENVKTLGKLMEVNLF